MNKPLYVPERASLGTSQLADGRVLDLWPELYGTAKRSISRDLAAESGDNEWQYQIMYLAAVALMEWNGEGEPSGWYRHCATGRRRPGGDPAREYVAE